VGTTARYDGKNDRKNETNDSTSKADTLISAWGEVGTISIGDDIIEHTKSRDVQNEAGQMKDGAEDSDAENPLFLPLAGEDKIHDLQSHDNATENYEGNSTAKHGISVLQAQTVL